MHRPAGVRRRRVVAAVAATIAVGALASACGADATPAGSVAHVVAGFYPLQFVAEQVGGARVRVTGLANRGAEPHDLELSPRQVADLADADLIIYLAGFQPAVDEAVSQNGAASSLDAATVVPMLGLATGRDPIGTPTSAPPAASDPRKDPHYWLDPTRLGTLANAVAERLATIDPEGGAGFRERAAALGMRLNELDRTLTDGLQTCQNREIVTSHTAFGYLADRYGLVQIGITGVSPEVEPTPQRLADIAAEARRVGATTIFFETLVSPRVAEAIAAEVGATTAVLDPLEGLPQGATGDYFSVMRQNLSTLESALACV